MTVSIEQWAAGETYEHFMGRWSWEVASQFLQWVPHEANQRWLDIGCGTGALTRRIVSITTPETTIGLDPSLDFVRYAAQQTREARFLVSNALDLAIREQMVDRVVSGLVLNFIPHPERVLREMYRVVKRGGIVAAYVWDYAGKMEFLRYFWDGVVALDAGATSLHEGHRFPLCQPDALNRLWHNAGFDDIMVDALDISTRFDSFEHYWRPFTVGGFPAPRYALSLHETERHILREHLRTTIPTNEDGSITLIARAWAVCGYKAT